MVSTERAASLVKAENKVKKRTKKKKTSAKSVASEGVSESAPLEGDPVNGVSDTEAEAAAKNPSAMLGSAVWLMLSSPGHKHLFVTDFEWLVVPPPLPNSFAFTGATTCLLVSSAGRECLKRLRCASLTDR